MTKAELPKKVRVACFDIDIENWHPHNANVRGAFGEFSALENRIRIDCSINDVKIIDTLVHEINHAIYWAYNIEDSDKEERIVATFATAWTQVYRSNPALLTFIAEMLGEKSNDKNTR